MQVKTEMLRGTVFVCTVFIQRSRYATFNVSLFANLNVESFTVLKFIAVRQIIKSLGKLF